MMSYIVSVDFCPAAEFLTSLQAFLNRKHHKTMELGQAWAKAVRQGLQPDFTAALAATGGSIAQLPMDRLLRRCPEPRDAATLIAWLADLDPAVLRDAGGAPSDPATIAPLQAAGVQVLRLWEAQYWRNVDPALLTALAAEAAARRQHVASVPPAVAVEEATQGVVLSAMPELHEVVLVPQWHFRPWNLYDFCGAQAIYHYPADVLPPAPGEPAPGLLRLTAALADPSRLRILRFLAAEPQSFTQVVSQTRLAKSTVHHHMVALRAAGLVRVHEVGGETRYSLRPGGFERLGPQLKGYLEGDRV